MPYDTSVGERAISSISRSALKAFHWHVAGLTLFFRPCSGRQHGRRRRDRDKCFFHLIFVFACQFEPDTKARLRGPTARCAWAYAHLSEDRSVHGSHRARIRTCRSSCSRSNVRPESDRCTMGGYTIQVCRRGRACRGAGIGMRFGQKLATTLAVRRRRPLAVSRSWGHRGEVHGASLCIERHSSRNSATSSMKFKIYCFAPAGRSPSLANRASKACLNAAAATVLSITIKSLSWRLRPDAEKFAAAARRNLPSG